MRDSQIWPYNVESIFKLKSRSTNHSQLILFTQYLMKFELSKPVTEATTLVDFIASHSDASKAQIKKALILGGGWVKKKGQKSKKRCRRAKADLKIGDHVSFYFDSRLLVAPLMKAELIEQNSHWGLWYKPAGVPSQGTLYGDSGCMLEQVQSTRNKNEAYLIHRLDTETAGIMIFAYSKNAAAELSALWQSKKVIKTYQAQILGTPESQIGSIDFPLDGKQSLTRYSVVNRDDLTSFVEVQIETGRYHQVRRHFAEIGHPIMGDPKYGKGNKNNDGLKLIATGLAFDCPITQIPIRAKIDAQQRLF